MIMRKLLILLVFSPLALFSQSKFGYFSYSTVLDSLPQYKEAMEGYKKLKQRCLREIEHNEQELTRFYVAFLDGHREFPEPILRKRQKEIQQMIDNSVVFRDQLKVWLRHAKDSLTAPSRHLVDSALQRVCSELSLMYAMNIDGGEYRYINPLCGQDITADIVSVILYPERLLREPVVVPVATDSVYVATDNVMCDTVPATERIPDVVNDSIVIPETERISDVVLPVTDTVVADSLKKE